MRFGPILSFIWQIDQITGETTACNIDPWFNSDYVAKLKLLIFTSHLGKTRTKKTTGIITLIDSGTSDTKVKHL